MNVDKKYVINVLKYNTNERKEQGKDGDFMQMGEIYRKPRCFCGNCENGSGMTDVPSD